MKIWLAVCTALSGALVALQICLIQSCSEVYEVDAEGKLLQRALESTDRPSKKQFYQQVAERVLPGDTVEMNRCSSWLPVLNNLEYERLTVVRNGRPIAVWRFGYFEWWGAFVGIAAVPLLIWAIVAAFLKSNAPPPPAPDSG